MQTPSQSFPFWGCCLGVDQLFQTSALESLISQITISQWEGMRLRLPSMTGSCLHMQTPPTSGVPASFMGVTRDNRWIGNNGWSSSPNPHSYPLSSAPLSTPHPPVSLIDIIGKPKHCSLSICTFLIMSSGYSLRRLSLAFDNR